MIGSSSSKSWNVILGLLWQSNYKIGCNWNREGNHFISIKGQFIANSISQGTTKQLAKTKGQYTMQRKSVTWITVKSPPHLNHESLHEILFNRQLPSGIVPLDIIHKLNHRHLRELLIPLLNISHREVKILKNSILGSITSITDVDIFKKFHGRRYTTLKKRQ